MTPARPRELEEDAKVLENMRHPLMDKRYSDVLTRAAYTIRVHAALLETLARAEAARAGILIDGSPEGWELDYGWHDDGERLQRFEGTIKAAPLLAALATLPEGTGHQ